MDSNARPTARLPRLATARAAAVSLAVAATVAVATGSAGCGANPEIGASAATARTRAPTSVALVVRALTTKVTSVGGSGIQLTPPAARTKPRTTAQAAFRVYRRMFENHLWDSSTATALLATYTSYGTGLSVTASPGSHLPPLLVWVILYNDVPAVFFGGPARPVSASPTPLPTYQHCQFALYINATTGRYIGAEQGGPEFTPFDWGLTPSG